MGKFYVLFSQKNLRSLRLFTLLLLIIPLSSCNKSTQNTTEHLAAPELLYHTRPVSTLQWHACDHGLPGSDCALLTVPLDYAHPHSGTVQIGISRIKAEDENQRIGALFVNAGGPGASGDGGLTVVGAGLSDRIKKVADSEDRKNAEILLHDFAELRKHFDIIGFDPRGLGRGDKLHCPYPLENPQLSMIPSTTTEYDTLATHNHLAGLACEKATGPLFEHIDTRYIADDIDSICKALGEKTIGYYGVSYGTEIGQLYAEKYPQNLRAIALDGNMNHAEQGWILLEQEARSEENALYYINGRCHKDPNCHVPHKSIIHSFDHLIAEANQGKLIYSTGAKISARDITNTVYAFLMHAQRGGFSFINNFFAHPSRNIDTSSYTTSPGTIAYTAVSCQDFILHQPDFNQFHMWVNRLKSIAPHMYRFSEFLTINAACLGWPIPAHNPPAPLRISPHLSVFLVANRIDPSTPLDYSVALHHLISGSRLLITDAVGHTSDINSHCGRVAIVKYLLSAQLPAHDEHCSG